MICKNCKHNNPENSAFCQKCGSKLKKATYLENQVKFFTKFMIITALIFFIGFGTISFLNRNFEFGYGLMYFSILAFCFALVFFLRTIVKYKAFNQDEKTYNLSIKSHFNDDKLLYEKLKEKLTMMDYHQIEGFSKPTYIKRGGMLAGGIDDYISINISNGVIYLETWCKQKENIFAPNKGGYGWDHKPMFLSEIEEIRKYFEF